MFKQKTYTGICSDFTTAAGAVPVYGTTGTLSGCVPLTRAFANVVVQFLKDCGCNDVRADECTVWIMGVPFVFLVAAGNNTHTSYRIVHMYGPFTNAVVVNGNPAFPTAGGTVYLRTFVFDMTTKEYKITLRMLGEPDSDFLLCFPSDVRGSKTGQYATATYAVLSSPYWLFWFNISAAKNLFTKRQSAILWVSGSQVFPFDIVDGKAVDIGYRQGASFTYSYNENLSLTNADKVTYANTVLLERQRWSQFLFENRYIRNAASSVPAPANAAADSQQFITVGDKGTFLVGNTPNQALVKITS